MVKNSVSGNGGRRELFSSDNERIRLIDDLCNLRLLETEICEDNSKEPLQP